MITREQLLIKKVEPVLPIIVFPERTVLTKKRENFEDASMDLKTELEI